MQRDDDANTHLDRKVIRPPSVQGDDCVVVIYASAHSDIGQRHVLKSPLTSIGRSRSNDIVIASEAVSRRHAEIVKEDVQLLLRDLDSTNGTFINDELERTTEHRLCRGDQIRIGDTVLKFLSGSDIESQYHAVVASMALTDGLTNLANRKHLDSQLVEEIARARRYGRELSLLMIDVDHFKHVNDVHGHVGGDSVLRRIGSVLQQRLRPGDKAGRYGGEEFCAILPETGRTDAARVAESLRAKLAEELFVADGKSISVTVSIGVAVLEPEMHYTDLYRAADQRMYRAKEQGRDRVCCEE
jgi:diguanylate cyclase (GGDEF)-like protein